MDSTPVSFIASASAAQDDAGEDATDCAINETPINARPNTLYFFSSHFTTGEPIIFANGPKGHRCIYPDMKGTFKGGPDYEDFHGIIHGPSSDFATIHSDGSISLDVNMVMRTHDGIPLLGKAIGRSTRDPNDPVKANFTTAFTFETGDGNLNFLNNIITIGHGKKDGNRIQIDYYLLED